MSEATFARRHGRLQRVDALPAGVLVLVLGEMGIGNPLPPAVVRRSSMCGRTRLTHWSELATA